MNGHQLWEYLLNQSPEGAVLMGGAIVDTFASIKVNDFDIFYTYIPGIKQPNWEPPANWKLTDQDFNDPEWLAEHQEKYLQGVDKNGDHPISVVSEYLVDNLYTVQLIGVNYDNPLLHFKNFDHSLTLGYFSTKGYYLSRRVIDSCAQKTITYLSKNKDPAAKARSFERAAYKAARYGDNGEWKFIGFD